MGNTLPEWFSFVWFLVYTGQLHIILSGRLHRIRKRLYRELFVALVPLTCLWACLILDGAIIAQLLVVCALVPCANILAVLLELQSDYDHFVSWFCTMHAGWLIETGKLSALAALGPGMAGESIVLLASLAQIALSGYFGSLWPLLLAFIIN